jgi:nucleoside-diphosphate-sugar epimerase
LLAHLERKGELGRARLFGSTARDVTTPDGTVLPMRALDTLTGADVDGAAVIHLAYLTKEKVETLGERRFTDTNLAIDDAVLAAFEGGRPRGVFVASSGAAALAETARDRHPYGLAKLRQEDRFLAWGARAGVPVLAGRIFNIAGPYINKIESYAIGSFFVQAQRDGAIRVAATVPVFRSFLHVDDLAALMVAATMRGVGRPAAVDLCGAEVLEMGDIAAAVAARHGDVPVLREAVNTATSGVYLGDFTATKSMAMTLGLELRAFSEQLSDIARWTDKQGCVT